MLYSLIGVTCWTQSFQVRIKLILLASLIPCFFSLVNLLIINYCLVGLPRDFSSPDYEIPKEAPCIIDKLCESHDGIPLEAKGIKAYCWKSHIKKLFEQRVSFINRFSRKVPNLNVLNVITLIVLLLQVLKGNAETCSGLLDVNNFEPNLKAINKQYEEHVLNVGDFDERIFLGKFELYSSFFFCWQSLFLPINWQGELWCF